MWLVTLVVLALVTGGPALAETPPQPLVPEGVEATPLCFNTGPLRAPDLLPIEPLQMASCKAEATCEDGSELECYGTNGDCLGGDQDCANGIQGGVACNGNEELCPACPCENPPSSTCTESAPCEPLCNNCGNGTCWQGSCRCDI